MRTLCLLLLSAWYCFGQLPVVPLQTFGNTWTPVSVPQAAYYWNTVDLSASASINSWTDRIQGLVLTNAGTTHPSANGSAGVYFAFAQTTWMTNTPKPLDTNYVLAVIVKPLVNDNGASASSIFWPIWATNQINSGWGLENKNGPGDVDGTSSLGVTPIGSPVPSADWADYAFVRSNSTGSSITVYIYTNGVLSASSSAVTPFTGIRAVGSDLNSGAKFPGYIAELAAYTNINDWRSYAALFHSYRTARYPSGVQRTTNTPFIASQSLSGLRNNFTGNVGFWFTPYYDITVQQLGRYVPAGCSNVHAITIFKKSDNSTVVTANLNLTNAPSGDYFYTNITPVTLSHQVSYYIESAEVNLKDPWYDVSTTVTVQKDPAQFGAPMGSVGGSANGTGFGATPNTTFVPPNFTFK